MDENQYFVYILSNKKYGTLYTGLTTNLAKRMYEHKNGVVSGFTKQYSIDQLVYFEMHEDEEEALEREKTIKKWRRNWKINLIERFNPGWLDLSYEILASI